MTLIMRAAGGRTYAGALTRVAITGIGLVTPFGIGRERSWTAFAEGRSGVTAITNIDVSGEKVRAAGEVKNAEADTLVTMFPAPVRSRIDRFVRFACAAATEALSHAGDPHRGAPERWGIIAGVGLGVPHPSQGYKVGPTSIVRVMPNAAPAWISILHGLRGPCLTVSTACASGAHAIGVALDQIRAGRADGVVAGGVDAVVTAEVIRAFHWMGALSAEERTPAELSRPFDATRKGFVLAEGAAFLVLERHDAAVARGARPIAMLDGWGMVSDAYSIVATAPDGEGMGRSMATALQDADLPPTVIEYVSAHGTGTRMNDREETRAIRRVFGAQADRLAVSSQKSMIGHAMGGAGAIEAAVTALSVERGLLTPTINLRNPDPECDLDYVPNESRRVNIAHAISNSFGFGGHNCTLVLSRADA